MSDSSIEPNTAEALSFLRRWPAATLQLTAIHISPDTGEKGLIETKAFDPDVDLDDGGAVEQWVAQRQGKANLYFTINTLRDAKDRKPKKADVESVVCLHVDIDVDAGVDQESGASALLEKVESFALEPSCIIRSGGGVQAFWILLPDDRIVVGGDTTKAEAAECYTRALEELFGSDHTHNVDRIMRLPGTINVPDRKKVEKGRKPMLARLVRFNDLRYPLSAFPTAAPKNALPVFVGAAGRASGPTASVLGSKYVPTQPPPRQLNIPQDKAREAFPTVDTLDKLQTLGLADYALLMLQHGNDWGQLHSLHIAIGHRTSEGPFTSNSELALALSTACLRAGLSYEQTAAVIANPAYEGTRHITKQEDASKKWRAVERTIGKAAKDLWNAAEHERAIRAGVPEWVECFDKAKLHPMPTMRNAKVALQALGLVIRKDMFHRKILITYPAGDVPLEVAPLIGECTDDCIDQLRNVIGMQFDCDLGPRNVWDAIRILALENKYDPVLDFLEEAKAAWIEDGSKERIGTMASKYFGCEPTELHQAIMRKHMIATVARARVPGCKYDDIPVLEGKEGTGKSTAIVILAGKENFSDQTILGANDQQAAERVVGRWMYEIADLAGMQRSESEQVKAFASRDTDRVRMAYGRMTEDIPRRNTFMGTTNNSKYLLSETGNRRFLPLETGVIDLQGLRDDRLLLWGEAVSAFEGGEVWVILDELLAQARVAQEERRVEHPWETILASIPHKVIDRDMDGRQEVRIIYEFPAVGHINKTEERCRGIEVLQYVLKVPPNQMQQHQTKTLKGMMERLGWSVKTARLGKGREADTSKVYYRIVDRPYNEPSSIKTESKAEPAKAEADKQAGIPF